ncbi:NAD(P)H-dependent oxidoreductase [Rickettsiales bacterium LUAb2]
MTTTHQEILSLLNNRHSCRDFDPNKKISASDFNIILEAARLSPSAFGLEPWKILVFSSPEAKINLQKAEIKGATRQLPNCSHFVLILSLTSQYLNYDSPYIKQLGETVQKIEPEALLAKIGRIKNFQQNDFKLNSNQLLESWGGKQCYLAMANMLLVSAMLKIDSCPIEGFNVAKLSENLQNYFNVDSSMYTPVVGIALGYRNYSDPTIKKRRPLKDIVEFFN